MTLQRNPVALCAVLIVTRSIAGHLQMSVHVFDDGSHCVPA
jgi:hypothetical protein